MEADDDIMELLTGDLRKIAEVAGVEAAVRIARAFRGCFIYVPGLDEVVRSARDEMIRKEYENGYSAKLLARKYGLSVRWVRTILGSPSCDFPEEILNLLREEI